MEAFTKGMGKLVASDEAINKSLRVFMDAIFDIIDTNHDGYIQLGEYEHHFKMTGLDPGMAKMAFDSIDTNKDGVLSREEFISANVEFHRSKEDTPAKNFFGPLLE